jgi:hypothetical protein
MSREKTISFNDLTSEDDSFTTYPNYIKHWEEATPKGWKIKILTESGLHIFDCQWRVYKRPRDVKEAGCPHN